MANNCSVILMQQAQNGSIYFEVFHWDNREEGETIAPSISNMDLRAALAKKLPVENKFTKNIRSSASTRTAANAAFASFISNNYQDTPP